MILSTCGASAAGFHTTSFAWRSAWARRTSHQGVVVVRMAAVFPAVFKNSRRVRIVASLPFHASEGQPLDNPTLEDEKHEHRRQRAHDGRWHQRPTEKQVLQHEVRQA